MPSRATARLASSGSCGIRNTQLTSGTSLITRLATAWYAHLERHAANGSILDLGCGSGNTANELAVDAYQNYVGVDISETCLSKARKRSKQSGRSDKNQFVSGDFLNYIPSQQFDVILFRESMYHVPMGKIVATVQHYSMYLRDGGVFIVRVGTINKDGTPKARPKAMIDIIKRECEVVENCQYEKFGAVVIVFRAKRVAQALR